MQEIKAGLRISQEGLSFFGLEEVNASIQRGAKVLAIKEGDAIMHKEKQGEENVRLSFSGFSVIVLIDK
ncbi:MAG: hypothetical protein HC836_31770 [Richelia sp. RM2_1_2]|nr:hypothetical protein [Richelia sp. SM2_1_7]NJN12835.1 hypothetical protein [Richelia sp. RM1_1_1]NJO62644.1 hypothetical protein [Richelia sp. RM2_1_2]